MSAAPEGDQDKALNAALDLMRRLPPSNISKNLISILELNPSLTEELLAYVDQPLKVRKCTQTSKEYLLCDYNRDGDSYRSPWSNEFEPPLNDGGMKPSGSVRKLEEKVNEAFEVYRKVYFEQGVSSCYCWDVEDGFGCVILIKKVVDTMSWDSIHVIEVAEQGKNAHYKVMSTIMLFMIKGDKFDLSGSLTRQEERDCPSDDHIVSIGQLVEDMEFRMRNSLQEVYFGKMMDIAMSVRSMQPDVQMSAKAALQKDLFGKLLQRSAGQGQETPNSA